MGCRTSRHPLKDVLTHGQAFCKWHAILDLGRKDRDAAFGTLQFSVAMRDPPTLVPRLDDVAVMGDPVEQRGGHLLVTGHSPNARLVVMITEVCW